MTGAADEDAAGVSDEATAGVADEDADGSGSTSSSGGRRSPRKGRRGSMEALMTARGEGSDSESLSRSKMIDNSSSKGYEG